MENIQKCSVWGYWDILKGFYLDGLEEVQVQQEVFFGKV